MYIYTCFPYWLFPITRYIPRAIGVYAGKYIFPHRFWLKLLVPPTLAIHWQFACQVTHCLLNIFSAQEGTIDSARYPTYRALFNTNRVY